MPITLLLFFGYSWLKLANAQKSNKLPEVDSIAVRVSATIFFSETLRLPHVVKVFLHIELESFSRDGSLTCALRNKYTRSVKRTDTNQKDRISHHRRSTRNSTNRLKAARCVTLDSHYSC